MHLKHNYFVHTNRGNEVSSLSSVYCNSIARLADYWIEIGLNNQPQISWLRLATASQYHHQQILLPDTSISFVLVATSPEFRLLIATCRSKEGCLFWMEHCIYRLDLLLTYIFIMIFTLKISISISFGYYISRSVQTYWFFNSKYNFYRKMLGVTNRRPILQTNHWVKCWGRRAAGSDR